MHVHAECLVHCQETIILSGRHDQGVEVPIGCQEHFDVRHTIVVALYAVFHLGRELSELHDSSS